MYATASIRRRTVIPADLGRLDAALTRVLRECGRAFTFHDLAERASDYGVSLGDVHAWLADARTRGLVTPIGYAKNHDGRPTGPLLWAPIERPHPRVDWSTKEAGVRLRR